MRALEDMAERRRQDLAELAELGMALARHVQTQAMAAPDAAVCDLTLAFHRVSRSVRQTHALAARLEREQRSAEREAAAQARRETLARVQRKRAQVRDALASEIWTEAEGCEDEAEVLFEALESCLMDEGLINEAFAEAPLEAAVARIRADLGLAAGNLAEEADETDADAGPAPRAHNDLADLAPGDLAYDAAPSPAWARRRTPADWRSSA